MVLLDEHDSNYTLYIRDLITCTIIFIIYIFILSSICVGITITFARGFSIEFGGLFTFSAGFQFFSQYFDKYWTVF